MFFDKKRLVFRGFNRPPLKELPKRMLRFFCVRRGLRNEGFRPLGGDHACCTLLKGMQHPLDDQAIKPPGLGLSL
ncbi:MAG: hypothetical protein EBT06_14070 [Gammaproteobacteria bacterium]|nr:hypothetical protein [Gammaproteobacteria bacterium]